MFLDTIREGLNTVEKKLAEWCQPVRDFLDNNPTLYKVCIVAIHFFRAAGMFALMVISPMPLAIPMIGVMLGFSALYFAAVERFCPWKFTLPSSIGGFAIWAAKAAIVAIIANTAFLTIASTVGTVLGLLSLAGYTAFVCYLSHRDVQTYLDKKNAALPTEQNDCCSGCCSNV